VLATDGEMMARGDDEAYAQKQMSMWRTWADKRRKKREQARFESCSVVYSDEREMRRRRVGRWSVI